MLAKQLPLSSCLQILTELEYSGIGRNKEQSARLLRHMIANAPKLVKPYQEPILKVARLCLFNYTSAYYLLFVIVIIHIICNFKYNGLYFTILTCTYNSGADSQVN